jgi:hypothetical protein
MDFVLRFTLLPLLSTDIHLASSTNTTTDHRHDATIVLSRISHHHTHNTALLPLTSNLPLLERGGPRLTKRLRPVLGTFYSQPNPLCNTTSCWRSQYARLLLRHAFQSCPLLLVALTRMAITYA